MATPLNELQLPTLKAGDIRWWKCKICGEFRLPADTRIVGRQQCTECVACGTVFKLTYKGKYRTGKDKPVSVLWSLNLQKGTKGYKLIEPSILRVVKTEQDGFVIGTTQPQVCQVSDEDIQRIARFESGEEKSPI